MKRFKVLSILMAVMFLLTATAFGADPTTLKKNVWNAEQIFKKGVTAENFITLNGSPVATASSELFYVRSTTGSDTRGNDQGLSWKKPFATLDYANDQCTASQGCTIILLPYHAETEAAAASIATLNVAGVNVIGIGEEAAMPSFTIAHADGTLTVSAADIRLSGIRFVSNLDNVKVLLTMSATSDGSIVENCQFRDSAADKDYLVGISVAAAAHGVKIKNNSFMTTAAAGGNNAILTLAVTGLEVIGNVAHGKFATGVMLGSGKITRGVIRDNIFVNAEAAIAVALENTSTGILAGNFLGGTTSMAAALTGDDAMWCFENYISGAVAVSGLINPAVDAD